MRAKGGKVESVYVIRRSDGIKRYIDERSQAGTARSTAVGKAMRFKSKWLAWDYVVNACGVPENWVPVRLRKSK
jgi:hypothetical protein